MNQDIFMSVVLLIASAAFLASSRRETEGLDLLDTTFLLRVLSALAFLGAAALLAIHYGLISPDVL